MPWGEFFISACAECVTDSWQVKSEEQDRTIHELVIRGGVDMAALRKKFR